MRKTNSKEVRQVVRAYLLECIKDEEVDTLVGLRERFLKEKSNEIRRVGIRQACIYWLQGLAINCKYSYYDIARILANWLDDTIESQERWIEECGDQLYWFLMSREILNAKKK